MPYTHRSCENLIREGIARNKIYVISNPIFEVINHFKNKIEASKILKKLSLEENNYAICTLHREENVDNKNKFKIYVELLNQIATRPKIKIIFSVHPRTKINLKNLI